MRLHSKADVYLVKYLIIGFHMKTFISVCSLIGLAVMSSGELAVDYASYGTYLTHHKHCEKPGNR